MGGLAGPYAQQGTRVLGSAGGEKVTACGIMLVMNHTCRGSYCHHDCSPMGPG